jgi:fused signal recognition particle receptor
LTKIHRVIGRFDPSAPHEVLLILDAGIGQNALRQVREFGNAVKVTGLAVTKLDGTAKGGVLFAIARSTGLPIRFIGVGEDIDDLRPFDADAFVSAIVSESMD